MSLARSALIASRTAVSPLRTQVRFAHGPGNVIDHTLPTSVKSKPWLAIKMLTFFVVGLGIPPYACYWHIQKARGG